MRMWWFALLVLMSAAVAAPESAVIRKNTLTFDSQESKDSLTVDVGTVTGAQLTGDLPADKWAGLYGNATGSHVIGDDSGSLFQWRTSPARYVYLDEDGINFFNNWSAGNKSLLRREYPYLDSSVEGADTLNSTLTINSSLQKSNISGAAAVRTLDGAGSPYWDTAYLYDGSDGFFAGVVEVTGTSFLGEEVDYQMMVPEKGSDGDPVSYGVWMEVQ